MVPPLVLVLEILLNIPDFKYYMFDHHNLIAMRCQFQFFQEFQFQLKKLSKLKNEKKAPGTPVQIIQNNFNFFHDGTLIVIFSGNGEIIATTKITQKEENAMSKNENA